MPIVVEFRAVIFKGEDNVFTYMFNDEYEYKPENAFVDLKYNYEIEPWSPTFEDLPKEEWVVHYCNEDESINLLGLSEELVKDLHRLAKFCINEFYEEEEAEARELGFTGDTSEEVLANYLTTFRDDLKVMIDRALKETRAKSYS